MAEGFKWFASSSDGCFEDMSEKVFKTKKECYEDMRNAALEKMKWNTQYDEDFEDEDDEWIGYHVMFSKDKITHDSYSGLYTYQIINVGTDNAIKHYHELEQMVKRTKLTYSQAVDLFKGHNVTTECFDLNYKSICVTIGNEDGNAVVSPNNVEVYANGILLETISKIPY